MFGSNRTLVENRKLNGNINSDIRDLEICMSQSIVFGIDRALFENREFIKITPASTPYINSVAQKGSKNSKLININPGRWRSMATGKVTSGTKK